MSIDIERMVRDANTVSGEGELEALFSDDIAGRLLSEILQERKGRMADTRETTAERKLRRAPDREAPKRGRTWWLSAAAVIVIVVGSAFVLIRTTNTDAAAAPGVQVASDMLDALYERDVAYESYFVDEETRREFSDWVELFFGLGLSGTYTCDQTGVRPGFVTCETISQTEFAELGGLAPVNGVATFVVSDDVITSVSVGMDGVLVNDDMPTLLEQESAWIHRTYPDVWSELFGVGCEFGDDPDCVHFIPNPPAWKTTRENGSMILELAPEFMESSSLWPRTG